MKSPQLMLAVVEAARALDRAARPGAIHPDGDECVSFVDDGTGPGFWECSVCDGGVPARWNKGEILPCVDFPHDSDCPAVALRDALRAHDAAPEWPDEEAERAGFEAWCRSRPDSRKWTVAQMRYGHGYRAGYVADAWKAWKARAALDAAAG